MKKITFYTLWNNNGNAAAVKVKGYTDGIYNYYKDNYGYWHCVINRYGLSFPGAFITRKAAVENAYSMEMQDKLYDWLKRNNVTDVMNRYNKLVEKAMEEK